MSGVDEGRPDPDALLRKVQAEGQRAERARLKLFFGYSPGVGKTYTMLEAAQRAHKDGVDVAVGLVETHGRAETAALLDGLDVLPRAAVEYKGATLSELDLDAAKARKPKVLLVDELAHTNAPGSRHAKRWQDVLELLDAGIDVWSTLNVQHVESLNDAVAAVTHVVVRETVPDAILDRADEIELVDLPLDELFARLREGKVYLGDAAERALQSFFRRGNLLALRELALRRTAERIDNDIRAFRDENEVRVTWPTAPRILVCVGASPTSVRVVRAARRMSDEADAPWVAAWVESPLTPLSDADRARLESHLKLAERLGARIVRLAGGNVADAVVDYAHEENIGVIVVGRSFATGWRDVARNIIRGSLVQQLLRSQSAADIDVRVVGGRAERARDGAGAAGAQAALGNNAEGRERLKPPRAGALASTAAFVGVATAIAWLIGVGRIAAPDIVMLYLAVIMIVAVQLGRAPAVFAAALSVLAYDFFFIPPFYTFAVSDLRNVFTFAMMFVVGIFMSTLASRLKRQEVLALARERRTESVLALTKTMALADSEEAIASTLAEHVAGVFQREAAVLLPNRAGGAGAGGEGALLVRGAVGIGALAPTEMGVAQWVQQHGRPAGRGTDTLPGAFCIALPILAHGSVEGVLAVLVRDRAEERVLDADQRDLAEAFARQTAVALERLRLAEVARAQAVQRRTEEMRSSLLSAVSHDLRTPLAAITGAATTLRDESAPVLASERRALLDTIADEGFHLERMVASLLDMTRVESGTLMLRREWLPVDELVGSALARVEARLVGRVVSTAVAPNLPLVHVDPVLLEQTLVNLLDNAIKHTPPGSAIVVGAALVASEAAARQLELSVDDDGPGVPDGIDVFEKFVRGPGAARGGVGLGLAICKGIAEAHGGAIRVEKSAALGGARFVVRVPLPAEPPPPAREPST